MLVRANNSLKLGRKKDSPLAGGVRANRRDNRRQDTVILEFIIRERRLLRAEVAQQLGDQLFPPPTTL